MIREDVKHDIHIKPKFYKFEFLGNLVFLTRRT